MTLNGDGALVGVTFEPLIPPGDYVVRGGGVLYNLGTGAATPTEAEFISGDGRHIGSRNHPFTITANGPIAIEDRLAQFTDYNVPASAAGGR